MSTGSREVILKMVQTLKDGDFKVGKEWPDVQGTLMWRVSMRLYGEANPSGAVLVDIISRRSGLSVLDVEIACQLAGSARSHTEARNLVRRWLTGELKLK